MANRCLQVQDSSPKSLNILGKELVEGDLRGEPSPEETAGVCWPYL